MPDAVVDAFEAQVIDQFRVNVAGTPDALDYGAYLSIPSGNRTGDEANVVDQIFVRLTLEWLGWAMGDWRYNQPEAGHTKNPHEPASHQANTPGSVH